MDADTVVLAVAIALSPTGVLASVLLLTTERGTRKAGAFALGWVLAIGVIGTLTLIAESHLDLEPGSTTSTASAWLDVVLGAVIVAMSLRARRRRAGGPPEPAWMARLDQMPTIVALGFGIFMPPYVVAVAAANSIVRADGSSASPTTVVVVTAIASLGVLAPWIAAVTAPSADRWIATWRTWLLANWRSSLTWLLLFVGGWLVAKGLYELAA